MAFIDRSNIGNAKIAGMSHDLKLVGLEYNIALTGMTPKRLRVFGTSLILIRQQHSLCLTHYLKYPATLC